MDTAVNKEERLVVRVCFTDENGNYRSAFCLNPQLKVGVPDGMTRIEYIEVLKYRDAINSLAYCIHMLKNEPSNSDMKGWVAELWVYGNQGSFLDKFCEETGIPQNTIKIDIHEWKEQGPDLTMKAIRSITDKYGNSFMEGEVIAVFSVKSTTTHDPEIFQKQVENGRKWLRDFLANPGNDFKTAKYGISVVLDYDIWVSSEDGLSMSESIGSYNNPYMEIIWKGD